MQGMQPWKSQEEFLLESISLLRSLQCCKARSPWPALSTQSQGDGAVPTGSPSELPNLPKPNQNKAVSSPTGAKQACQGRWSVHTLLHKSSRQRLVHTAADSETSPGSGRRAGAAPPSPGLDCS